MCCSRLHPIPCPLPTSWEGEQYPLLASPFQGGGWEGGEMIFYLFIEVVTQPLNIIHLHCRGPVGNRTPSSIN
ncbi:MAG: hypothetical protein AMS27_12870 [Bacteroides sp. SM23_62_1]|nr:MAG: hypothetical protein AMS27_12870 [Bacteroides sp. SM23_62_1]